MEMLIKVGGYMQPLGSNDYRSTLSPEIVLTQVFKSGRKYEKIRLLGRQRERIRRESELFAEDGGRRSRCPQIALVGSLCLFTKGDVSLDEAG